MPASSSSLIRSRVLTFSLLMAASSQALCISQSGPGSDETILIEQETPSELCYSAVFKQLSNHLFGFDVDAMLSTKQRTQDAVVRHFSDYAERINYKVDLNHDEVTLEMKLTF